MPPKRPEKAFYKGHGARVMALMRKEYGKRKAESVFYATVNSMREGTKAQRAAQPKTPPGAKRK